MKNKAPANVEALTRARTAQPKPYESINFSMWLPAVIRKENHSDLPFLPDRM
jgi:hypothetical protein